MRAKDIGEMKRFMHFELCYTELHDAMSSSGTCSCSSPKMLTRLPNAR